EADEGDKCLTGIPELKSTDALGIGPGIGKDQQTVYALEEVLRNFSKPVVIDADALNLLSEHTHLQELIPENSILTPHPGEFSRLVGEWNDDFERLEKQRDLAERLNAIIVLKGAHTSVAMPDRSVYFNVSGNPGMATGGSGDVLTGVLTALLAQGIEPSNAALTGVYAHGLAGDIAARYKSQIGMTAGDLIEYLPEAWSLLEP
ncbi:MAG: NAD(P)H-hydrate dehydratase, partial [Cyclobacteriaceae bacterium]